MEDKFVTRGFQGKRRDDEFKTRKPPGQYITNGFPVLTAGTTPHIDLKDWSFSLNSKSFDPVIWNWHDFNALRSEKFVKDIHCVTTWSKLDTSWRGVSIDTLLEVLDLDIDYLEPYVRVECYGGYTTNLALEDLVDGKAFIATQFEGSPLATEHGGPARLVVPHLYFWKSAKWVESFHFMDENEAGFWEALGYHDRGDPWKEERYQGD